MHHLKAHQLPEVLQRPGTHHLKAELAERLQASLGAKEPNDNRELEADNEFG